MSETDKQVREGNKATLIRHCAVFGRKRKEVRKFRVTDPAPFAQYPVAVTIWITEPRKRTSFGYRATPDNLTYLTVEVQGAVVYDSRSDVPCDMEKWEDIYQKHKAEWLERKADNDRAMARSPGMTIVAMGNFEEGNE
jgi:hypothetical protein